MTLFNKLLCTVLSWTLFVFTFPVHLHGQDEQVRKRQSTVGGQAVEQTIIGEGELTIAILDLEGRGISQLEAQTLTDRMRSELVKTGAVTIVERSQMQEILEEQGFQQTGCVSDECAVEVGKLLGVHNMVTGSIGKIGQSYTLDVRMFNVETGAIIKTENRTYRGEIDGLIMEIERLAWDIVELTPPAGRFPSEEPVVAAAAPPAPAEEAKPGKKGGLGRLLLWTTVLAAAGGGAYYYLVLMPVEEKPLPAPPTLP
jgi:hypothetical protein